MAKRKGQAHRRGRDGGSRRFENRRARPQVAQVWRFRRRPGRRLRSRDRQSLWIRGNGDGWNHQLKRAPEPRRWFRRLPANQRGDQSREQRRSADQSARRNHRDQHGDLLQEWRLAGDRVCHSVKIPCTPRSRACSNRAASCTAISASSTLGAGDEETEGVIIDEVVADSPAATANLKPGDVIKEIQRTRREGVFRSCAPWFRGWK